MHLHLFSETETETETDLDQAAGSTQDSLVVGYSSSCDAVVARAG